MNDQERIAFLERRIEELEARLAKEIARLDDYDKSFLDLESFEKYVMNHCREHGELSRMIYPAFYKTHPEALSTMLEVENILGPQRLETEPALLNVDQRARLQTYVDSLHEAGAYAPKHEIAIAHIIRTERPHAQPTEISSVISRARDEARRREALEQRDREEQREREHLAAQTQAIKDAEKQREEQRLKELARRREVLEQSDREEQREREHLAAQMQAIKDAEK